MPNRFDRAEWAGAFGDLGTFIPFAVAYIAVVKIEPFDLLFTFGAALLICGLYYRTPFPVQPMKAIGAVAATQAAQTATITAAAVSAAALVTGLIWLCLGLSGAAHSISRRVPRAVIVGIILGLALNFMFEGLRMMSDGWLLASVALLATFLLLSNRAVPAMFMLLLLGIGFGAAQNPHHLQLLLASRPQLHWPRYGLTGLSWHEVLIGTAFLALPQLPLTLGNAVIAIREENNRLFPARPVTDDGIAVSTGIMNLAAALLGGVPMCHGAGGMAGHVAFGARSGGAPIILGTCLLGLALFFSSSIHVLFELFARPVLGVILFFTGAQLALGTGDFRRLRAEPFITLTTAALAMVNVGVAFLVGLTLSYLARRGWLRA